MISLFKRKKGVSPVIATILIIGLTLAAAAIVFLVVMPMLNPTTKPNLVLQQVVAIKDYDNDGNADYIALEMSSIQGGIDANITAITIYATDGTNSLETSWEPLTSNSSEIAVGEQKILQFKPVTDNLDEIPNGYSMSMIIVCNEDIALSFDLETATVETGEPVVIEFEDASGNPIVGASIDFYYTTGEFAYSGEKTNSEGKSITYLFPGEYYARAAQALTFYYTDTFVHPGVSHLKLQAGGGELTIKVQSGATALSGVPVYLFDEFGHYLGKSGTTGGDGLVTFSVDNGSYIARADYLGYGYYSPVINYPTEQSAIIDVGGGTVYCKVIDGGNNPITNTRVYLFRATGSYTGRYAYTNGTGIATFTSLGGGQLYKFRVDYLALHLWSQEFAAANNSVIPVNIGGGTVYVNVTDGSGAPIKNTRTYLFTSSDRYTGKYTYTNSSGISTFTKVSAGYFKVRIDYLAQRFWSPVFNATDGLIVQASIGGGTLYGNITASGNPITNARVYLFTNSDRYTGKYGYTNASGIVEIQGVGTGNYKLRVDYQAGRHWSDPFYFNETTVVDVDIGGGTVYANVTDAEGTPIVNVRVYAFTASGSYTGFYAYTNASGIAKFNVLSAGTYKFRIDYLAQRFWSQTFDAQDGLIVDVNLGGGTLTVHLINNYGTEITNTRVYLFTASGSYTGKYAYTNASGYAIFTGIGASSYKLRADYLATQYWSEVISFSTSMEYEFNIGGGIVYMHVFDGSGTDISGPRAYLFTSSGRYTGYYAYLNASGFVACPRIGNGTFKWRVDYLAMHYWSPEFPAVNGTVLEYNIGGGTIYAYIEANGSPVNNQRVYLFTSTGSYTGKYAYTNSSGYAVFTGIGNGDFKFRVDYSGNRYWSSVFTAQADLVVTISITTSFNLLFAVADTWTVAVKI